MINLGVIIQRGVKTINHVLDVSRILQPIIILSQ